MSVQSSHSIRLRIVLGEFGRLGHDGADVGVDLLEVVLAGIAVLEDARLDLLDRIVLLAHLLHFFLRAVLRRVGHRVAAIAVGQHLEDVGALARAAVLDGPVAGVLHRAHVHAVHLLGRNAEGLAALEQAARRCAVERGAAVPMA